MTPTKLPTVLGIAALLVAVGLATPSSAYTRADLECVTLTTGETACGYAEPSLCAGFGEGEATGPVHWTVRVTTSNPSSVKDYSSPVAMHAWAGGGPAAQCWTSTCTWASILANGELVYANPMGIC